MRVRANSIRLDPTVVTSALPTLFSNWTTEMVENMKIVASEDRDLTVEERNLLSVAYKNVIGARRASWRIVTSIEQKEESKGNTSQVMLIKEYRNKIEAELANICEDILQVLDQHLVPSASAGESKVFYHKMYVAGGPACCSPSYAHVAKRNTLLSGRETTTATWPSLPLATAARTLPTNRSKPTRPLPRLPRRSFPLLTPFVSVLPSTSPCSTTRSSMLPTRRVILPSRRLTMPLPVRLSLSPHFPPLSIASLTYYRA